MKKILFTLLFAFISVAGLSAATERVTEINVIVGESVRIHPAGMLLLGVSPEEGAEFADLSQEGYAVLIKGLKEGKASYKLSLRYGKTGKLLVNVVTRSFTRRAKKDEEPEKPQWAGGYELRIPENNFCISYSYFGSDGEEDKETTWARIDDTVIHSDYSYEEGWAAYSKYDYVENLGYSGGFNSDMEFRYYLADGDAPDGPAGIEAGHNWFDEYAPQPAGTALYGEMPTWFGWDNQLRDYLEPGMVIQRMRQYGRKQSYLNRFYRGEEEVFGVKCWVFDMRGMGSYGVSDLCWWIDPATGLALKYLAEDGSGMIVKTYNLDYREWDVFARPELFQ